jgi:hypothetical protein
MDNTPCKYNELKMGDVFITYLKMKKVRLDVQPEKAICRVTRVTPQGNVYAYAFTKGELFSIGDKEFHKCIDTKDTEHEFRLTRTQYHYNRILNHEYRDDDILFMHVYAQCSILPIHVLHAMYAEIE